MEQNLYEKNMLLNTFLDERFFNGITKSMELIIRPECDQKCEYCYINKHGKDLFPIETRKSKKELLNNLDIFLNYLINERKTISEQYEIFAGDLFSDDIFFDILDIFYKYYLELQKNPNELIKQVKETIIMVPNSLSFLKDKEKEIRFDEYYNKLKTVGLRLIVSYSTDGIYAVSSREKREVDQEWFDKTFSFCAKYGFGVHPMISVENVEHIIDNYNWFIENLSKYHLPSSPLWHPMFVEVRGNNWTDETFSKYLEFVNYVFDYRLELFDGNIYELAKHLSQTTLDRDVPLRIPTNDPIKLYVQDGYTQTAINCSLGRNLSVNIATLEIVPCHRLAYPHLAGGIFKIQDNKILEPESKNNLSSYITMLEHNKFFRPGCTMCEINKFCQKGCFGAQYETYGDPFISIPTICNFYKQKINFLLDKYINTGLMDILLNPNFEKYSPIFAEEVKKLLIFRERQSREKEKK